MTRLQVIDLNLSSIDSDRVSMTFWRDQLIVLFNDQLIGFNYRNGFRLFETPIQSVVKITSVQNRFWCLKNNQRALAEIIPTNALELRAINLSTTGTFSNNSILCGEHLNKLWLSDNTNQLYIYDILTDTLSNNSILPASTYKNSCIQNELVYVGLDNRIIVLNDQAIAIDSYNNNYESNIQDLRAIAIKENKLYLLTVDGLLVIKSLLEFPEYSFVQFTDTSLTINGVNTSNINSLITDKTGKTSNLRVNNYSTEFLTIKPVDLLSYVLKNNNAVNTNINNTSVASQTMRLKHHHVIKENLNTVSHPVDGVNEEFLLVNTSIDDNGIKLYQNGYLLAQGLGHDYTTANNREITFIDPPTSGTTLVTSYLITNEFSFGHKHKTVTPAGTVDGVNTTFLLPEIPALGSLHLYKQGFLMQQDVDYTLINSTIVFAQPVELSTNLSAHYYVFNESDLDSRHIHVTDVFKYNFTTPELILSDRPLTDAIHVSLQGQTLIKNIDFTIDFNRKAIVFSESLIANTLVAVHYIIAATSLESNYTILDDDPDSFLTLEPNDYWTLQLPDMLLIQAIEIQANSVSDSMLSIESSVDLNNYELLDTVAIASQPVNYTSGQFASNKKTTISANSIRLSNNSLQSLQLRTFKVFVRGDLVSSNLQVINSQADVSGYSLAKYSASGNTINFVKSSLFENSRDWQLNGTATIDKTSHFSLSNADTSLRLVGVGNSDNISRAYQQVILNQQLVRAITISFYVNGSITTNSQWCGLIITPYVTETVSTVNGIQVQEQELAPIQLVNIPEGIYRERRFSELYLPPLPLSKVQLHFSCEKETIGILHICQVQLEQGTLSNFVSNNVRTSTVKAFVEY